MCLQLPTTKRSTTADCCCKPRCFSDEIRDYKRTQFWKFRKRISALICIEHLPTSHCGRTSRARVLSSLSLAACFQTVWTQSACRSLGHLIKPLLLAFTCNRASCVCKTLDESRICDKNRATAADGGARSARPTSSDDVERHKSDAVSSAVLSGRRRFGSVEERRRSSFKVCR